MTYEEIEYIEGKIDVYIENQIKLRGKDETIQKKTEIHKEIYNL